MKNIIPFMLIFPLYAMDAPSNLEQHLAKPLREYSRSGDSTPVRVLAPVPSGSIYIRALILISISDSRLNLDNDLIKIHYYKYPKTMKEVLLSISCRFAAQQVLNTEKGHSFSTQESSEYKKFRKIWDKFKELQQEEDQNI
jgi:hypothetical protein